MSSCTSLLSPYSHFPNSSGDLTLSPRQSHHGGMGSQTASRRGSSHRTCRCLQARLSAVSNVWSVISEMCSSCANSKLLSAMNLFVLSQRSVTHQRGKAGAGGWEADTKDSIALRLVQGANSLVKDPGRKRNRQTVPTGQLALLEFRWSSRFLSENEMSPRKTSSPASGGKPCLPRPEKVR